jgi:hypothetical protein
MRKRNHGGPARPRVLVLVDESNVGSSVRTAGRGLDWLKLRDFLAGPNTGRDLIEMVVYAGLPPAIPTWQEEQDRKNKFVHWLRSNGNPYSRPALHELGSANVSERKRCSRNHSHGIRERRAVGERIGVRLGLH